MPNREIPDHSSAVIECNVESLGEEHWSLMLMADPDRKAISEYLPDCRLFSISAQGSPIALALLLSSNGAYGKKLKLSEGEAEIINIAVTPEQQGKGLAKRLILHCVGAGRLARLRRLWIGTGNSSLPQLALYQKAGFRLDHIIPDYFSDYPETIFENGIQCLDMLRLQLTLTREVSDVGTKN